SRNDFQEYSRLGSVPIGRAVGNTKLLVLDKQSNLCPPMVTGELYIGGDGVAGGYLNNAALTAQKFIPIGNLGNDTHGGSLLKTLCALFPHNAPAADALLYRTGDLVRRLDDGSIEFLGRTDFQVKIRGFRIEPGEIESRLLSHPNIEEALVRAIATPPAAGASTDTEEHTLCAYIVPASLTDERTLKEVLRMHLAEFLPPYMVPDHFVMLENMPLTGTGKVDTRALPLPRQGPPTGTASQPPANRIEKKLATLWADILYGAPDTPVGRDDNFFQCGGHSLKAAVLTARIHKYFQVNLPLGKFFAAPTIRALGHLIVETSKETFIAVPFAEKREYYPLSSAQKRLYLLDQMLPGTTLYNMPYTIFLGKDIDFDGFEKVITQLIHRHDSFRTSFHMIDGEPVQRIHETIEFAPEYVSADGRGRFPGDTLQGDAEEISLPAPAGYMKSFDLSQAPLMRVAVWERKDGHILLLDMHHIISDGTSQEIMEREFHSLYFQPPAESPAAPIGLQYKDYAVFQSSKEQKQITAGQENFWLNELSGEQPLLDLPTDFPRPPVRSFEGQLLHFTIEPSETVGLTELARKHDATVFMVALSAFYVLLARLSGQEDIIVGTPTAGRPHADLQHIIGMFVNTVALRNRPRFNIPFDDFLQEVRDNTLAAFENQDLQFEDIVEKVSVERDTGRNPIFDVMFTMRTKGHDGASPESPQASADTATTGIRRGGPMNAKFDITFTGIRTGDNIRFAVDFCSKLFTVELMERFIRYFKRILTEVITRPGICAGEIDILSSEEKRQLLTDFHCTQRRFPTDKTLACLFDQQVEKNPGKIALTLTEPVSGKSLQLTYRALNERARLLARHLVERKNPTHPFVGLMAEPSVDMIAGILAILKAGLAYVPLNPKAPAARNEFMLRECRAELFLTSRSLSNNVDFDHEVLYFEDLSAVQAATSLHGETASKSENISVPHSLAYLIFTSGSTGKPKGVPITHFNVTPLLQWGYANLDIGPGNLALRNVPYYFDWSVWEIFIVLTNGAQLMVVPESLLLDPASCIDFIETNNVDILHVTPTQCSYLMDHVKNPLNLKYLFMAAEKLTRGLLNLCLDSVVEECRIFNQYGPTEAAILAAVHQITPHNRNQYQALSSVPIGGAVGNTQLLVLDKQLNLCPYMVTGELYIGGDCVAAGYLNNPHLTRDTFIPAQSLPVSRLFSTLPAEAPIRRSPFFYRTGDLVRRLADGNFLFQGRVDFQVKIRGFRIELGEIETRLSSHHDLKEAVVFDITDKSGEPFLCAWYTSETSKIIDDKDLRYHLATFLPDYMIPTFFVRVEKMPLNPNGKIHRKALPAPRAQYTEGGGAPESFTPPQKGLEEKLARIWGEVLNIEPERISSDADFFHLGGHSLKATIVASRIRSLLKLNISVLEIFQ
ncbi:MAG: amino acid adenylation domain-containing protein, partial [bacterium]|nr:amino acid adenylation domain-containing protein [bacterium]